jgi:hypothetical protein
MKEEPVISLRAWLMLFLLVAVTIGFVEQPIQASPGPGMPFHGPVAPAYRHHGPLLAC